MIFARIGNSESIQEYKKVKYQINFPLIENILYRVLLDY